MSELVPEEDQPALILIAFLVGTAVLPSLIPSLGRTAGAWAISHGILLEPTAALFTLPGLDAGPDIFRMVALILALTCVGMAATNPKRKDKKKEEESRG